MHVFVLCCSVSLMFKVVSCSILLFWGPQELCTVFTIQNTLFCGSGFTVSFWDAGLWVPAPNVFDSGCGVFKQQVNQ